MGAVMKVQPIGVDWRPFLAEFPILFGEGRFITLWVGERWFELLWDLCVTLEATAGKRVADGHPPIRVVQVKEKYGTLRVYVEGGCDEVFDLIDAAETRSRTTCETCGRPGSTICLDDWDRTLCPAHELLARLSARPKH